MFFIMKFFRDVTVSPSDLSKDLKKILKVKLLKNVSGTIHPEYGYFIKILRVHDEEIKKGIIMEGSGDIIFKMQYDVIVMRPFVGEVAEGIIENVFKEGGIHVRVGPMVVYIDGNQIPHAYNFDKNNESYLNEKNGTELKKGIKIRFRYTEIQIDNGEFKPIGTILDDYLGYNQD